MDQQPSESVIVEALYDALPLKESVTIKDGAVRVRYKEEGTLLYFWEAWEIAEMLNLAIGMLSAIAMSASILSRFKVCEDVLIEIVAQSLFTTQMRAAQAQISAEITTQRPQIVVKYNNGPVLGLSLGEARMHSLALSTAAAGLSGSISLARALMGKGVSEEYIEDIFEKVGRARNIMEMEIMHTGGELYLEEGKRNNDK